MKTNFRIFQSKAPLYIDQIRSLTYESYLEKGFISSNSDKRIDMYDKLDALDQTRILIAEEENKVVGSASITIDGPEGLHTDIHFKKESDIIRAENKKLATCWRFVIDRSYRNQISLSKNIIYSTYEILEKEGIEDLILWFSAKDIPFYIRMFNAKLVAIKEIQFNKKSFHSALLRTTTEDMKQFLINSRMLK